MNDRPLNASCRRLLTLLGSALLACGGRSASLPFGAGGGGGVAGGSPEMVDAAAPMDAASEPPIEPPQGIPELGNVALGGSPEADVVALGVLEMLQAYCGECHSTGDNGAGFAGGLDIVELIERGMIVPGSSATSPLLARIVDGSMPPADARGRPTAGDVALLAGFIDGLRRTLPASCEPLPFLDLDAALLAIQSDVLSRPPQARPYLRYLSVSYASNARLCAAALDQQRHALFKSINGVSTNGEIRVPVPIDDDRLLYRIDIRDYGWNRPIDVEGDGVIDHSDGWLAVVDAAEPYAVELVGPEASVLSRETGAAVSFLPVNAFVHAVTTGDLYYALIGAAPNIGEAQLALGVDMIAALAGRVARRAAFFRDVVSRYDNVIVTRVPQAAFPNHSYWFMETQDQPRGSSIYDDPLDAFPGDWSQSIFDLPNGLRAYSVNAADGARLAEIPSGCVERCYRPEKTNAASCHGCHGQGLLPVEDTIREYVETNPMQYDFETFAAVQATYLPIPEMAQLITQDDERYLTALERAGVPRELPDPISRVFLQFEVDPLDIERAAAELGVTADVFREALDDLTPAFGPLESSGSIERSTFGSAFTQALCRVHSASRNRPSVCP